MKERRTCHHVPGWLQVAIHRQVIEDVFIQQILSVQRSQQGIQQRLSTPPTHSVLSLLRCNTHGSQKRSFCSPQQPNEQYCHQLTWWDSTGFKESLPSLHKASHPGWQSVRTCNWSCNLSLTASQQRNCRLYYAHVPCTSLKGVLMRQTPHEMWTCSLTRHLINLRFASDLGKIPAVGEGFMMVP